MSINFQPLIDFSITAFVLLAMFVLIYCSIRKCGIRDVWDEIRGISQDKLSQAGEITSYVNR
jgi:hypothetical protein